MFGTAISSSQFMGAIMIALLVSWLIFCLANTVFVSRKRSAEAVPVKPMQTATVEVPQHSMAMAMAATNEHEH